MLRICQLSGQEIARLDQEALTTLQETKYGNSVRALKWHLSKAVGGVSIYRLKLIRGENPVEDACQLLSLLEEMERNQVKLIDLVLMILEYHTPTEEEEKTFLEAAEAGNTSTLETMLQLPADPNGIVVAPDEAADNMTEVDMSALILAADRGHLAAVELLLDAGADFEHVNSFDETPLYCAAYRNHIEVLRHLILQGAALDRPNRNQETALMVAIRQGHEVAVEALIQAGAALKPPVLHLAAEHGYLRMVQLLLEGRAEVNGLDDLGRTALHIASEGRREDFVDVARLLLQFNADVDAETPEGDTPLSLSCLSAFAAHLRGAAGPVGGSMARLLRSSGADVERAALAAGRRVVHGTLSDVRQCGTKIPPGVEPPPV